MWLVIHLEKKNSVLPQKTLLSLCGDRLLYSLIGWNRKQPYHKLHSLIGRTVLSIFPYFFLVLNIIQRTNSIMFFQQSFKLASCLLVCYARRLAGFRMAFPRRMGLQMSSFPPNNVIPIKVAFQGEAGAYSEKATREMLGSRVTTVPCKSFEDAFKAVASREVDYAVLPIENSLGGSIHANYDLLLRYDLHIIGEHEFRVEHSLLALPGVKRQDIVKVMSHPQALAQCDNYLRAWGVKGEEAYDTAGSAKMIADNNLRDCAAIASGGHPFGLVSLYDAHTYD